MNRAAAWYSVAAVLITGIGVARIASTYREFTQVVDEPGHIAGGMQLLQDGAYDIEMAHAPLGRLFDALGPYFAGLRMPPARQRVDSGDGVKNLQEWGNGLLAENGDYWRNLTLARMGALPFFLLACAVVWRWSDRLWGKRAALFALLSFTLLPAILAHGALATTDMAITATFAFAVYRLVLWMENPGWGATAWVGVGFGLAVLSKFSTVVFFWLRGSIGGPGSRNGSRRGPAATGAAATGGSSIVFWSRRLCDGVRGLSFQRRTHRAEDLPPAQDG